MKNNALFDATIQRQFNTDSILEMRICLYCKFGFGKRLSIETSRIQEDN